MNVQILLVMLICLIIPVLPVYLGSTSPSGDKFPSSDFLFENPDQENSLFDRIEGELKIFGPFAFFAIFLIGTSLSDQSSYLSSRSLSLRHKTSVLRC